MNDERLMKLIEWAYDSERNLEAIKNDYNEDELRWLFNLILVLKNEIDNDFMSQFSALINQ